MEKKFKAVDWSSKCSIYEVNVRQYTREGTFEAFSRHIPRLHDMGIDVLWFMPVTPISEATRQGTLGSYYACSDYVSVNPEFGDLEDFRAVVQMAHNHGMKVIIDWVANHTGWDHTWVHSHPEFYKKNAAGHFYDSNNWHDVIDLNYYDQSLRKAMVDAMRFWIEAAGIDGFRCDMAHLVPLDFWRNARLELEQIKPLYWLAETEQINYDQVFDCIYGWNWMHQTDAFFQGKVHIDRLRDALKTMVSNFPLCDHLLFTTNHDENSWNGTEYEKYGSAALPLAVFCATWKGVPLIYSGQEAANHKRLKFFDKDEVEWPVNSALQAFYKTLLQFRKGHSALNSDKYSDAIMLETGAYEKSLAFLRLKSNRKVLVVLNISEQDIVLTLNDPRIEGTYRDIFSGEEIDIVGSRNFSLPVGGYKVYGD